MTHWCTLLTCLWFDSNIATLCSGSRPWHLHIIINLVGMKLRIASVMLRWMQISRLVINPFNIPPRITSSFPSNIMILNCFVARRWCKWKHKQVPIIHASSGNWCRGRIFPAGAIHWAVQSQVTTWWQNAYAPASGLEKSCWGTSRCCGIGSYRL